MDIKTIHIAGAGEISVELPQSFAARLDLLTAWGAEDADRGRLMWGVLGACWADKNRLPSYRPDRGDRDVYKYAASVCEVMLGQWGMSPSTPVKVHTIDGEEIGLQKPDGSSIALTLWTVGFVLMQQITASIPRAEVIEDAAFFTKANGAA